MQAIRIISTYNTPVLKRHNTAVDLSNADAVLLNAVSVLINTDGVLTLEGK